jgi:hypothetical protein
MTTAERIAVALETLAASVAEPDTELLEKIANLDGIVRAFIGLMKDPQSTNDAWSDLLEDAMAALGIEEGVAS